MLPKNCRTQAAFIGGGDRDERKSESDHDEMKDPSWAAYPPCTSIPAMRTRQIAIVVADAAPLLGSLGILRRGLFFGLYVGMLSNLPTIEGHAWLNGLTCSLQKDP